VRQGEPARRGRAGSGPHLDREGEHEADELADLVVAVERIVLGDELEVGREERRGRRVQDVPARERAR